MREEPAGELGQSGGFTWWDPLANSDGHVRTSAWLALFVLVRLQGCRSGRTGPARCGPSRRSGSDACAVRGERCLVEGRGKCWAILPRSSVAPLDVLMHVENNLTANLLHSFSFLFRTFCPASAAHLPDPSFCTLSDEREKENGLSSPSAAPRLLPHPVPLSLFREPLVYERYPLTPNRIHNLNFWVIQGEKEKERRGRSVREEKSAGTQVGGEDRRAAR